jgi:hypothetical protein
LKEGKDYYDGFAKDMHMAMSADGNLDMNDIGQTCDKPTIRATAMLVRIYISSERYYPDKSYDLSMTTIAEGEGPAEFKKRWKKVKDIFDAIIR